MRPKCAPGDLAIIVEAFNEVNLGTIVKVLALHPDQGALLVPATDVLWTCEATHQMTYDIGGIKKTMHRGPAPDSSLHPIRGVTNLHEIDLIFDFCWSVKQVEEFIVTDHPDSFL